MVGLRRPDAARARDRAAGNRLDVRARDLPATRSRSGQRDGRATGGAVEVLKRAKRWIVISTQPVKLGRQHDEGPAPDTLSRQQAAPGFADSGPFSPAH